MCYRSCLFTTFLWTPYLLNVLTFHNPTLDFSTGRSIYGRDILMYLVSHYSTKCTGKDVTLRECQRSAEVT